MKTRRISLKLDTRERESLVASYLQMAIPIDQFEERPSDLRTLCAKWEAESGRHENPEAVLHYMRTQRKAGKWPRLNGNHVRRKKRMVLSVDEREILVSIVENEVMAMGVGTDEIAYAPEIGRLIAKEFEAETGRRVRVGDLIAEITAIRKRGLLDHVEKQPMSKENIGFDDIDDAD